MESIVWKEYLNDWLSSFYSMPIVILSQIFSIVCGVFFFKKEKLYILFISYAFSGLLLFTLLDLIIRSQDIHGRQLRVVTEISNSTFAWLETITFFSFFSSLLKSKIAKIGMKIFLIIFSGLILFLFLKISDPGFSGKSILAYSSFLTSFQLFFILLLCLFYYSQLFKDITSLSLTNRPSFWIVNSIFFYSLIVVPYFTISHQVFLSDRSIYRVYSFVHYMSLSLVYFSIAIGFLWRKPLTT